MQRGRLGSYVRPPKKSKKLMLSAFCLIIASLLFFRDHLASQLLSSYLSFLHKAQGADVLFYKSKNIEHGRLHIEGLRVQSSGVRLDVPELNVYCQVSLIPFKIETHIALFSPDVLLLCEKNHQTKVTIPSWIFPSTCIKPIVEIDKGSLHMIGKAQDPLYFTFQQEEKEGCIGHLSIQEREGEDPVCDALFFHDAHDVRILAQVKASDASSYLPLMTPFAPFHNISALDGALQGSLEIVISQETKIKKIVASCRANDCFIQGQDLTARLGLFNASMQYPAKTSDLDEHAPFWKNILATAVFEEMSLKGSALSQLKVNNAKGSLAVDPEQDPSLCMDMDLSVGSNSIAAHLVSSGSSHSDGRFWLDSKLTFAAKNDTASIHVSLCSLEDTERVVSLELHKLDTQIVELLRASALFPMEALFSAQTISGRFLAWVEEGRFRKIQVNDAKLLGLCLHAADKNTIMTANFGCDRALLRKEGSMWIVSECKMDVEGASFSHKDIHLSDANCHINYHDSFFEDSTLSLEAKDGHLSIKASGPIDDVHIDMEAKILCNSLLSFFPIHDGVAFPKSSSLSAKVGGVFRDRKIHLHADAIVANVGEVASSVVLELEIPLEFTQGFFPNKISFSDLKGKLFAPRISSFAYAPFLSQLPIESTGTGDMALDAELYHGKIKGTFWSDDLFWQTQNIAMSLGPITKGSAGFSFDFFTKKHSAFIDLSDAFFAEQSTEISLSHIAGRVVFEDHRMKGECLTASVEGIVVPFSMYYDVEGLFVETKRVEGSLKKLSSASIIRKHLAPFVEQVAADFIVPEGGCNLFLQRGQSGWLLHYKVATSLSNIDIVMPSDMHLKGRCDLFFDSSTSIVGVKNSSAILSLKSCDYDISFDDFVFDPRNPSPFKLFVDYQKSRVLSLCGHISLTHQLVIGFDKEKTSLFSQPLYINKMILDSKLALCELDISCVIDQKMRSHLLDHFIRFPPLEQASLHALSSPCRTIEGDLLFRGAYTSLEGFSLDITAKGLNAGIHEIHDLIIHAKGKAGVWEIDTCCWDDKNLQGIIRCKDKKIFFQNLSFNDPQISFQTTACIDLSSKEIQIDKSNMLVSLDLFAKHLSEHSGRLAASFAGKVCLREDMHIECLDGKILLEGSVKQRTNPLSPTYKFIMEKPSCFFFSQGEGLCFKAPSWKVMDESSKKAIMTLGAEQIRIHTDLAGGFVSRLSLDMAQEGTAAAIASFPSLKEFLSMKKDAIWKVKAEGAFSSGSLEASLSLATGIYVVGRNEYHLIDPNLQISSTGMHLHSKVKAKNTTLFCDLGKDFIRNAPIYILLRSSPEAEGLKILCMQNGDDIEPLRFEGKLLGIDVSIQKSQHITDGSFFGVIKIDCKAAAPILPDSLQEIISTMKLGSGLKMQGHFFLPSDDRSPFSFRGEITGDRCDLLGYTFDHLYIKANLSPDRVLLEDIKIEDLAGSLVIKTCQIDKDLVSEKWSLSIPLGHIKEFRPSILREGESRAAEKPFLIKNLSVYDMQGVIGDKKSFTAKGALQFSNSAKKGFSLLDIPFEMIKDLGLDLGILSPVVGEADFMLKKGRCIFHELKNSYSEGRRSEFFLAPDTLAYIDLDGNWNVDLKMKQHVLLKWSQSLLVSIRGTLAKPKYSLKNVDSS